VAVLTDVALQDLVKGQALPLLQLGLIRRGLDGDLASDGILRLQQLGIQIVNAQRLAGSAVLHPGER
jgi:hypothetical protein